MSDLSSTERTTFEADHPHDVLTQMFHEILQYAIRADMHDLERFRSFLESNLALIQSIMEIKTLTPHIRPSHTSLTLHDVTLKLDSLSKMPPSSHHPDSTLEGIPSSSQSSSRVATGHERKSINPKPLHPSTDPSSPSSTSPSPSSLGKPTIYTPPLQKSSPLSPVVITSPQVVCHPDFDPTPLGEFHRALLPPKKNAKVQYLLVLDNLQLHPYGVCKTCRKGEEGCDTCDAKGGIRATVTGFLLSEQAVQFTVWTDHLIQLLGMGKRALLRAVGHQEREALRKIVLESYRGRLIAVHGYYAAYRGRLTLNATSLQPKTWTCLLPS